MGLTNFTCKKKYVGYQIYYIYDILHVLPKKIERLKKNRRKQPRRMTTIKANATNMSMY